MALMPDIVGHVIDGYTLHSLIGLGAMGAVYRAIHVENGDEVAIKVLPTTLAEDPENLKRFEREAHIIASLDHPNIIPIYGFGMQDGMGYIIMKLLTGRTLMHWIHDRRNDLTPLDEVGDILNTIGAALEFAHQRGVVHRDIKPNNVMFDDRGNLYIVDFGIAKVAHATSALTGTGTMLGTPEYMAPEQWTGRNAVAGTDQYAVGVLAYQLCTGKLPFRAESPLAMMHLHLHEQAQPVHDLRADLPFALNKVLKVAMEKDPGYRFPSVSAFTKAFEHVVKQGLIKQPLPSTPSTKQFDMSELEPPKSDTVIFDLIEISEPASPYQKSNAWWRPAWLAAALLFGTLAIVGLMLVLGGNKDDNRDSGQNVAGVATETPIPTASPTDEPTATSSPVPSATPTIAPTATAFSTIAPTATQSLPTATLVESATIYELVEMVSGLAVYEDPSASNRLFAAAARTGFAPFVAGQYMDDDGETWLYLYYYDVGELDNGWSRADELTLDADERAELDMIDPDNTPEFPDDLAYYERAERPYGSGVVAASTTASQNDSDSGNTTNNNPPRLEIVDARCAEDGGLLGSFSAVFTVRNAGGAMTTPAPWTMAWSGGSSQGQLQLGTGQTTTLRSGTSIGEFRLTISPPDSSALNSSVSCP